MGLPLIGMAAGGVLGGVKNHQKRAAYNRDKEYQALTAQYSPWTGMKAEMPQRPGDGVGDILGGALSGASLGDSIGKSGWFDSSPVSGQVGGAMAGGFDSGPQSMWDKSLFNNSRRSIV